MSVNLKVDRLISTGLASALPFDLDLLIGPPDLQPLPTADVDLFRLLDQQPMASPAAGLSLVYGRMLNSMPDSFVKRLADKNFDDPSYWFPAEPTLPQAKTPLYNPSTKDILVALKKGSELDFSYDSSQIDGEQADALYGLLGYARFHLTLHIRKVSCLMVRPAGWFSHGAFVSAYTSQGHDWLTGPDTISWSELFGGEGILRSLISQLVAISGISLSLRVFGIDDPSHLLNLSPGTTGLAWPVDWQIPNQEPSCWRADGDCYILEMVLPEATVLLGLLLSSVTPPAGM